MKYMKRWIVNFKILLMFIVGWLPLGLLSLLLWLPANLHTLVTKKLNEFGTYLIQYKLINDPPDLAKVLNKMLK